MKFFLTLFAIGFAVQPFSSRGSETAHATLWCLSPRFQQSFDENELFSLDLSSESSEINGELVPFFYFFDPNTTHSAYITIIDQLFSDEYPGAMDLNVPEDADANGNGFADFFESSQGISATSSGSYNIPDLGSGAVDASWSRSPGSTQGTCVLTFNNTSFGNIIFHASFEILEYTGDIAYTPGLSVVFANIGLTNTGDATKTFQGPLTFVKSETNRFNMLTLQAGIWTDENSTSLPFDSEYISRFPDWPTNYSGYFDFDDDGDFDTFQPYSTWTFSIDDLNDADSDGIPDFSDDPMIAPPRNPSLALGVGMSENLLLTISGDIGHEYQIQANTSLSSTNWVNVSSVTLTNDPQTVSLPLPETMTKFWRVVTQ